MKIVVGLGNPGKKYKSTRHNIGFRIIDAICQLSIVNCQPFKLERRFKAEVSECIIGNERVSLLKPQTFMNNSGEAVSSFLNYYKILPENMIVIHDDVDLHLGAIKISLGEGAAGHKGIESIISALGSKNYWRVRVGILNRPKEEIDTEKFVLEKFSKSELEIIEKVIKKVLEEFEEIFKKGIEPKKITIPNP